MISIIVKNNTMIRILAIEILKISLLVSLIIKNHLKTDGVP
jgi:hypothetical protein